MSDRAWDREAQYEFLLHIVAQFENGRTVNWGAINIPGRTPKALQNQWTKVRKDLAVIQSKSKDAGASGNDSSPAKKKRGRKPAAKAVEVRPESDDDDDEGVPPSKYIKSKRVASQDIGGRKRVKKEEDVPDVKVKQEKNHDDEEI